MSYRMLPYGYQSYTGHIWCNHHIDVYNAYCARCDAIEQAKGHLPENMANGRHHLFTMFSRPVSR